MAHELIDQTLQVNLVNHNVISPNTGGVIGAQGTGFFETIGCSLTIIAVIALAIGLVVFLLRIKYRHKQSTRKIARGSFITGAGLLLLVAACAIPASVGATQVGNDNMVTINLDLPDGQDSATGTQDTELVLGQDYTDGYIVFVYTEPDNNLRHIGLEDTALIPTRPAASVEEMSMNSYGVKDAQQNYVALSTDRMHPTRIAGKPDGTTSGTVVPLVYAAKVNSTMATGSYQSVANSVHLEVTPDIYHLTYVDPLTGDDTVEQLHNATFELKPAPSATGYVFKEYNTEPDGSGTTYYPGDKLSVDYVETKIYTIWQENPEHCNPSATNISEAVCMQDINQSVRDSMTQERQYQLRDERDGKFYYLAKLKDGNVWMTQNLDFDIVVDAGGKSNVTAELSDVSSDWTTSSTYIPKNTETTISSSAIATDTRSWNLGDYYYDGVTSTSCDTDRPVYSYADCEGKGFNRTGNRHYHAGNIYQWNTATAGSGGSVTTREEAPDSICPKGWRLPRGYSTGEFKALIDAYNVIDPTLPYPTVQILINKPLYMTRGGTVGLGRLVDAADKGIYWSSTGFPQGAAYSLFFGGTGAVLPSGHNNRYDGFSVRCVADID